MTATDAKTRKTILNTNGLLAEMSLAPIVASFDGDWGDSGHERTNDEAFRESGNRNHGQTPPGI